LAAIHLKLITLQAITLLLLALILVAQNKNTLAFLKCAAALEGATLGTA